MNEESRIIPAESAGSEEVGTNPDGSQYRIKRNRISPRTLDRLARLVSEDVTREEETLP